MPNRLYFAYGSNQLSMQLIARGARPRSARTALLRDHRFTFDKRSAQGGSRANVVPDRGRVVVGTAFELDALDVPHLQRFEPGYVAREVAVEWLDGDGGAAAFTFVAEHRVPTAGCPPAAYVDKITSGLREQGAPEAWCAHVFREAALAAPAYRLLVPRDAAAASERVRSAEALLVRLRNGWVRAPELLVQFCRSAVAAQRDSSSGLVDGSWSLLPDAKVDRDVRFALAVLPSAIVTSILARVSSEHPSVASEVAGFDTALRRGLDFVAATGLAGHGMDSTSGTLDLVHALADGDVPAILANEPDLSPRLARVLRETRSSLADLAPNAPSRATWGTPGRHEIEDALARLRGAENA
jgi:hypothetical protein